MPRRVLACLGPPGLLARCLALCLVGGQALGPQHNAARVMLVRMPSLGPVMACSLLVL
jgi:hypothetical protein